MSCFVWVILGLWTDRFLRRIKTSEINSWKTWTWIQSLPLADVIWGEFLFPEASVRSCLSGAWYTEGVSGPAEAQLCALSGLQYSLMLRSPWSGTHRPPRDERRLSVSLIYMPSFVQYHLASRHYLPAGETDSERIHVALVCGVGGACSAVGAWWIFLWPQSSPSKDCWVTISARSEVCSDFCHLLWNRSVGPWWQL